MAADRDQPLQAAMTEVVSDDPLHDPPDRVLADPQQAGDGDLAICCASHLTTPSEVAGVVRIVAGPRHRLEVNAAVAAAQATQLAFDHQRLAPRSR